MNPVRFSLRYPQVAYTITVMLLAGGIHSLLNMPRREDPKTDFPGALVIVLYPGATAEQVETQLTKRVEDLLFTYADLRKDRTRSVSRPGLMLVWLWAEDGVEDKPQLWAKLQHSMNRLSFTGLPQGVLGPIVDSEFGEQDIALYYVEREPGRLSHRSIEAWCRDQMGDFMVPRYFCAVAEFPKTETQRIQKGILHDQIRLRGAYDAQRKEMMR